MLKIKDKTGSTIAILKDDASEPELTKKADEAKKEGEQDATVGRLQESGDDSAEEEAGS